MSVWRGGRFPLVFVSVEDGRRQDAKGWYCRSVSQDTATRRAGSRAGTFGFVLSDMRDLEVDPETTGEFRTVRLNLELNE